MKMNATITVLCLAVLASLGWGIREHRQAGQLNGEPAQAVEERLRTNDRTITELRGQLARQQGEAETEKTKYEAEIARLNTKLSETSLAAGNAQKNEKILQEMKAKIAEAKARISAPGAVDPAKSAPGKPMMAGLAKMMKNPEMRKMALSQQKAMLDMTYGSLYGMLNLPDNQRAALKDLLEKRQTAMINAGFDMMDDSLTAAQKAEKQKQISDMTAQYKKEIEALLGKENNTVFTAYEESNGERMQVRTFNQSLDKELQLNETQENDLIWALHKTRSDFKFTTDVDKTMRDDPSSLTPEVSSQFLEDQKRLNAQCLEVAGKMLTPAQLEQFRAHQEQQQAMQEMALKMFSDGTANAPGPGAPTPPAAKP